MINTSLLQLLEKKFGKGIIVKGDELKVHCPFCNHYKPKLQINLNLTSNKFGYFHCWVCQTNGRTLYQLFKKLKFPKSDFDTVSQILKSVNYSGTSFDAGHIEKSKSDIILSLPTEFLPLWKSHSSPEYKHAMLYLKSRGIDHRLILKYKIGYCESGKFSNRIIIPSYDEFGQLNFYVGRDFTGQSPLSYKLCSSTKDIIGFDLFINWNLPIVLVEGVFDAISVRRNAIPLFGKTISEKLKYKIYQKKVKRIYILLDPDAMRESLQLTEEFLNNGIVVHHVDLKEGQDAGSVGFPNIIHIINETPELSFARLIQYKLNG